MEVKLEDKLAYIIAVVNDFAAKFALNSQQAYRYLSRYGAIKVAHDFYDVMHTQPMNDMVESMVSYCHRKGGHI